MNILSMIKSFIDNKMNRSSMSAYYRIEYNREWRHCREMYPLVTDAQLANLCFPRDIRH